MANPQNLRTLSPSEAREQGRRGGLASAAKRKKQKTLRELANQLGQMPLTNQKLIAKLHELGIDTDEMTNDMATMAVMQLKAQSGDTKAAKLLSELRGQYSTRVEVEPVQPKPLIDLTEAVPAETKPTRRKK